MLTIGFAGSRQVLPDDDTKQAREALATALDEARSTAGPETQLVAVCQVARGADQLFLEVCREKGVLVRVFLPQHRDEYLAARADGEPDFTEVEQTRARALLADRGLVIEERVVAHAPDRQERFHEANLEILRCSDAVLVLQNTTSTEVRPGGSAELVSLAKNRGVPTRGITRSPVGLVVEQTAGWPRTGPSEIPEGWLAPGPDASLNLRFREGADAVANREQKRFDLAAGAILLAHLLATACALVPFVWHDDRAYAALGVEVLLLAVGAFAHRSLHRSHIVRSWAAARLCGELARSACHAIGTGGAFDHLRQLPLPPAHREVLAALEVAHLGDPKEDWTQVRTRYLRDRIEHQVAYYDRSLRRAERQTSRAAAVFWAFTGSAMVVSSAKLVLGLAHAPVPDSVPPLLGSIAVIAPMVAVAAMSLAAAYDWEARVSTFRATLGALKDLRAGIEKAASEHDLRRLVWEVEARLLGETVGWYWRRAYTGVA